MTLLSIFGLFLGYVFVRRMDARMHQQLTIIKLGLEIDKVPVLNEVSCQVMHASTLYFDTNIMPGHPRLGFFVDIGDLELPGRINIAKSEITEVSSFP